MQIKVASFDGNLQSCPITTYDFSSKLLHAMYTNDQRVVWLKYRSLCTTASTTSYINKVMHSITVTHQCTFGKKEQANKKCTINDTLSHIESQTLTSLFGSIWLCEKGTRFYLLGCQNAYRNAQMILKRCTLN